MQTRAMAEVQELEWPYAYFSYKECSMSRVFSERRKKKRMVMAARKRVVSSQPMIILPSLFCWGQLICSQLISLGSGASPISTSHSSWGYIPNTSLSFSSGNYLNLAIISSFWSSLSHEKITFSAMHSSLIYNESSLSQYCSRAVSFSCSSLLSAYKRRLFSSLSCSFMAFFMRLITSFISSSIRQKSSYSGKKVNSCILYSFPRHSVSRWAILALVPFLQGRFLTRTEQSDSEQVLSSQQFLVLVMRSLMQRSTPRWRMNANTLETTSASSVSSTILAKQTMKLVQPFSSSLQCLMFQWMAQKSSIALQLQMSTSRRRMQYLRKTQKRGKPKPRNSSSLEFQHRGAFYFYVQFRQQGHNLVLLSLPKSQIPGKVESPCISAKDQSGLSLDNYILSKLYYYLEKKLKCQQTHKPTIPLLDAYNKEQGLPNSKKQSSSASSKSNKIRKMLILHEIFILLHFTQLTHEFLAVQLHKLIDETCFLSNRQKQSHRIPSCRVYQKCRSLFLQVRIDCDDKFLVEVGKVKAVTENYKIECLPLLGGKREVGDTVCLSPQKSTGFVSAGFPHVIFQVCGQVLNVVLLSISQLQ